MVFCYLLLFLYVCRCLQQQHVLPTPEGDGDAGNPSGGVGPRARNDVLEFSIRVQHVKAYVRGTHEI